MYETSKIQFYMIYYKLKIHFKIKFTGVLHNLLMLGVIVVFVEPANNIF